MTYRKRIAFTELGYRGSYLVTHPWKLVDWLWDEARWFVQRGLYGYAACDVWSLDSYLVKWLPGALRTLAKKSKGVPLDAYPDTVDWAQGATGEEDDAAAAKWTRILHSIADDLDTDIYLAGAEECERIQNAIRLMADWFFDLWW